nr:MAG TPA: hypothetical protein [Caudoviricetes sp.]
MFTGMASCEGHRGGLPPSGWHGKTQGAHAGARNVKASARDAGATYAILSREGAR